MRAPAWLSGRALAGFAAAVALLWVMPLVLPLSAYMHNVVGLTFMFMAAALAWNWLGGYVGQISFGHSAMFGVGGFAAARAILSLNLPFWTAWLAGGVIAGGYALVWGHPTLRLRGPYFSIATIGVGEATRLVATYWTDFTGGSSGLSLPLAGGPSKYQLYWYGLYLAAAVGVNAARYQDVVLVLSGTMVGVCGGFYASYQAFIDPQDMFSFDRAISFILMGVIGGLGTILGPTLGAIVFVIIQEFLLASYSQLYLGLYGILLVLIILFEPLGLSGLILRARRRLGWRPKAGVAAGGLGPPLARSLVAGGGPPDEGSAPDGEAPVDEDASPAERSARAESGST
jgi:branched-chain amino acid transport system permease protein